MVAQLNDDLESVDSEAVDPDEVLIKATPLRKFFSRELVKAYPALARCDSASEASKIRFGVKGMTALIFLREREGRAIAEFFGSDHSAMAEWFKHCGADNYSLHVRHAEWRPNGKRITLKTPKLEGHSSVEFNATPAHRKVYKAMVKTIGIANTVKAVASRDFADFARGWEFLAANRKRWDRFERDILSALDKWPAKTRYTMIHDYALEVMKRAERAARPRDPNAQPRQRRRNTYQPYQPPPDRPLVAFPGLPTTVGKFKVFVPGDDSDLRKIGNAQNHCVGSHGMGYGDKVRAGVVAIFAVYQSTLEDGVCVEVQLQGEDSSPYILQAQGRLRRGPNDKEAAAINVVAAGLDKSGAKDVDYVADADLYGDDA